MTLKLPDPLVNQRAWDEERTGVQRNFEEIAQAFPLAAGTENFQQFPQCRAYHDTTQNIATATLTAVALNSERWDLGAPAAQHDTATNNSRLTCVVPGLYAVTAHASFDINGTGERYLSIRLNGTTFLATQTTKPAAAALETVLSVATQYRLVAGDYVQATVYQNSGGTIALNGAAANSAELSFHWVSP